MTRPLAWPLLLALLLTLPVAVADDESGDETSHDQGEDRKSDEEDLVEDLVEEVSRKVKVNVEGTHVAVKIAREDAQEESEVKFDLNAENSRMRIAHETKNATEETEAELSVRFREVVEYVENGTNGAFDPGADEVVRRVNLERAAWTVVGPAAATNGNLTGHRIEARGVFPDGGSVAFVMYVYGDFANVNGTSLRPTDVKIDVLLEDWPYAHDESRLALRVDVERETETEIRGGDDEVRAAAGGQEAYFTWASEALVDGTMQPVGTTIVKDKTEIEGAEQETEQAIWLSYARGARVNHDPVMGIASEETHTHETPLAPVGLVLAGVAVLALLRRRV